MTNIYLLGASGSIGTQTLDVIRNNLDKFNLVSISIGHNIDKAREIIKEFNVEYVSVIEEEDAIKLRREFPKAIIESGKESLVRCATFNSVNKISNYHKVVIAVVGYSGLVPTIEAIKTRRDILLANKETLVCAGSIISKLVGEYNVHLIPIDSEHSAIFQAMQAGNKKEVSKIIITASGGAFRDLERSELKNVTLGDALHHPSWSMGDKITIDSATMVNKGLEVIEAHYLFNISYDKIETILHKESIIHSIVQFCDNSQIAQLSQSDMRIPIQYALTYPNRLEFNLSKPLDLVSIGALHFKKMDFERFPMLKLAYEVGKIGGVMPAVYNVSNEVANELFRNEKISFLDIEKVIFETCNMYMNKTNLPNGEKFEDVISIIQEVKEYINNKYS